MASWGVMGGVLHQATQHEGKGVLDVVTLLSRPGLKKATERMDYKTNLRPICPPLLPKHRNWRQNPVLAIMRYRPAMVSVPTLHIKAIIERSKLLSGEAWLKGGRQPGRAMGGVAPDSAQCGWSWASCLRGPCRASPPKSATGTAPERPDVRD